VLPSSRYLSRALVGRLDFAPGDLIVEYGPGTEPADALEPAAEPEHGTLARMGVGDDCRLLCSAKTRRGRVVVLGDALAE
jgi:hypothetical protein